MTSKKPESDRLVAGRYRITRRLGSGGMGVVWCAHDERLDVDVALKELRFPAERPGGGGVGVGGGAIRDDLFRGGTAPGTAGVAVREARHAAKLRGHPHIVAVHDAFVDGGRPWIVMDLVAAQSLQSRVGTQGPLPVAEAARLGISVLDALAYGRSRGVLHCDVKPPNILLAHDGRILLTDFGVAHHAADPTVTPHLSIGTPAFMAPERLSGAAATFKADLFSLGATLYYAVAGTSPFGRPGNSETMEAVLRGEPEVPPGAGHLWPAISGLLAKDPRLRLGADGARALLVWACTAPAPRARESASPTAAVPTLTPPEPPPEHAAAAGPAADSAIPADRLGQGAAPNAPAQPAPEAAGPAPGSGAPVPGSGAPVPGSGGPGPGSAGPGPGAALPLADSAAPIPEAAGFRPGSAAPVPDQAAPLSVAASRREVVARLEAHPGLRRARARSLARGEWGAPSRPGGAGPGGCDAAIGTAAGLAADPDADAIPVQLAAPGGGSPGSPGFLGSPGSPGSPGSWRDAAGAQDDDGPGWLNGRLRGVAVAVGGLAVLVAAVLGTSWAAGRDSASGNGGSAAVGAVPGGFVGRWHGSVVQGGGVVETSVVVRGGGVGADVGEIITDSDSAALRCTAGLVLLSVHDPVLAVQVPAADATRCGLAHAARLTLHADGTLGFYVEATHRSPAAAGRLTRG